MSRLQRLYEKLRFSTKSFNRLVWPAVCLNCKRDISEFEGGLCRTCWEELSFCTSGDYCRSCGKQVSKYAIINGRCPQCPDSGHNFDGIVRVGRYSGVLRELILAYKHGRTELQDLFEFMANAALKASEFYEEIELLIPVPLHWTRYLYRGYNQAGIIAKRLEHPAEISTDLVRIRKTSSQPLMMNSQQRAANVAGAFAVRWNHNFTGKTICLVDDIKTSGATLNECARTLKQAGAEKVYGLVLTVAGQQM